MPLKVEGGGGRAAAGGRGERHYTSHNHIYTQSHTVIHVVGGAHDTRHERHAIHTHTHVSHPDAVPGRRAPARPTRHTHIHPHAHVYVCAYTHHSTHAVVRTHARGTRSWRLRHAPAWWTLPPASPPSVWPCTSRWRRPTHGGCGPHSRWPAVGRQGSMRLRGHVASPPEGAGRGRQGSGRRGERHYTSHNHIHTQSHTVTHVVKGVHTTRGTSGTPYTHIHTRCQP